MCSCRAGNTPAACRGLRPGKPARAPSSSKSDGSRSTRERGRLARMLSRHVPLSSLRWATRPPSRRERHGLGRSGDLAPPGSAWEGCGPASRRVPLREARVMGAGPPGSAGVPPACTPVPSRSVSLRWATRHPAGRNAMGSAEAESWSPPGARASRPHAVPSRAAQFPGMGQPAALPAGTAARPKRSPGAVAGRAEWRRLPGFASVVRASRSRSRVGLHPVTSSQHSPAFLSGRRAGPSRCCSTFPREAARTANRSRERPSAAPPVRRSRAK